MERSGHIHGLQPGLMLRAYDFVLDRVPHESCSIVNIQLSHEIIPMAVHGAKADIESFSDLMAVQSLSYITKDLGFSPTQWKT